MKKENKKILDVYERDQVICLDFNLWNRYLLSNSRLFLLQNKHFIALFQTANQINLLIFGKNPTNLELYSLSLISQGYFLKRYNIAAVLYFDAKQL